MSIVVFRIVINIFSASCLVSKGTSICTDYNQQQIVQMPKRYKQVFVLLQLQV